MAILIAKVILSGSLIGIGLILVRKIPVLREIPEAEIERFNWKTFFSKFRRFKIFSLELILQKLLSKIRILTLIIGRKTESQLQKLREKSERKEAREKDNYWEELRKAKKLKK